MIRKTLFIIAVLILATGLGSGFSEDDQSKGKSQKGIRFNVPDDWPIEDKGGSLAPVSVEEYVTRKFKAIESKLDSIEKDIAKKTEEKPAASTIKQSSSSVSSETASQLESITKNIAQLKAQLESLRSAKSQEASTTQESKEIKNITDELKFIRTWVEDIEKAVKNIEFHLDL